MAIVALSTSQLTAQRGRTQRLGVAPHWRLRRRHPRTWCSVAPFRVSARRLVGLMSRRRGGLPAHRPSGRGPGCGGASNGANGPPNPAGGAFVWFIQSHFRSFLHKKPPRNRLLQQQQQKLCRAVWCHGVSFACGGRPKIRSAGGGARGGARVTAQQSSGNRVVTGSAMHHQLMSPNRPSQTLRSSQFVRMHTSPPSSLCPGGVRIEALLLGAIEAPHEASSQLVRASEVASWKWSIFFTSLGVARGPCRPRACLILCSRVRVPTRSTPSGRVCSGALP